MQVQREVERRRRLRERDRVRGQGQAEARLVMVVGAVAQQLEHVEDAGVPLAPDRHELARHLARQEDDTGVAIEDRRLAVHRCAIAARRHRQAEVAEQPHESVVRHRRHVGDLRLQGAGDQPRQQIADDHRIAVEQQDPARIGGQRLGIELQLVGRWAPAVEALHDPHLGAFALERCPRLGGDVADHADQEAGARERPPETAQRAHQAPGLGQMTRAILRHAAEDDLRGPQPRQGAREPAQPPGALPPEATPAPGGSPVAVNEPPPPRRLDPRQLLVPQLELREGPPRHLLELFHPFRLTRDLQLQIGVGDPLLSRHRHGTLARRRGQRHRQQVFVGFLELPLPDSSQAARIVAPASLAARKVGRHLEPREELHRLREQGAPLNAPRQQALAQFAVREVLLEAAAAQRQTGPLRGHVQRRGEAVGGAGDRPEQAALGNGGAECEQLPVVNRPGADRRPGIELYLDVEAPPQQRQCDLHRMAVDEKIEGLWHQPVPCLQKERCARVLPSPDRFAGPPCEERSGGARLVVLEAWHAGGGRLQGSGPAPVQAGFVEADEVQVLEVPAQVAFARRQQPRPHVDAG